mgnify:CR=1 FL=1|jgi:hypothetical protein
MWFELKVSVSTKYQADEFSGRDMGYRNELFSQYL